VRIARRTSFVLRWVSLVLVAAAIVLTMIQLVAYSRLRESYPPGMTIAGVPVGGTDPQTAGQRLLQVYNSTPVEIQYAGAAIHLDPAVAGFQIDTESMLAAADLQRTGSSFWLGFWGFLWNRQMGATDMPLITSLSEERLRQYLKDEVTSRYDLPATPAEPVPGKFSFKPGTGGQELNIDHAVTLIEDALKSPTNRSVTLTFEHTPPGRPLLQNLEVLIKKQVFDEQQTIGDIVYNRFDGVVGFYLQDLQTGQELHFGYNQNHDIPAEPDIAFTASSTIKIPIMVSVFKNLGPDLDQSTQDLILEMIIKSENPASDALMRRIDPVRGPLIVTEDMKAIGLENTFMGGFFCDVFNPCPLLQRFDTPANQRTDVTTDPDVYNQTTPSDMGILLADLYQCAQNDGGALVVAFPGKLNQSVCQKIIGYLERDKIGSLIEAGLPEGTRIAHKHGWTPNAAGITQEFSDAAIVYTPGGNYVLVIYVHHPVQAFGDPVLKMFAQISEAVYNYFNVPAQ